MRASAAVLVVVMAVICQMWRHGQPMPAPTPPGTCSFHEGGGSCPGRSAVHGSSPDPHAARRQAARGLYIVRFRLYHMAAEHRRRLEELLPTGGWQWVERDNAAMRHPTDFGLLRLDEELTGSVKAALEQLSVVKDVHPDRMVTRALLRQPSQQQQQQQQQDEAELRRASEQQQQPPHASPGQFEGCGADTHPLCVRKRPGRLQTRPTFSLEDNLGTEELPGSGINAPFIHNSSSRSAVRRRAGRRLAQSQNLATTLGADTLWAAGYRGKGIKMGVFDTGIKADHPDVKNIKERTNWTHEPTLEDKLGHGSFVAGVISGTDPSCPGLAPEVEIHTFRVFTNDQVSFTSWFLDAFNYAVATGMDVVNLSIGGPDYLDAPFVEKVLEITSNGIIMTSAIGNDGPLYGTLNNPADQNDVIGVGGIDYTGNLAAFSSRGMSTWELPLGYGRSKPDVVAYGKDVRGARIAGGCRTLSGTSVASPVVAGAVCLLASTVPEARRPDVLNPGAMKQALVEGARRLPLLNMYEQGQGALDVLAARDVLAAYTPRASVVPAELNLAECPYAWPFCRQALYAGAMPTMFNATLLNGMGVVGEVEGEPVWTPADEGGRLLDVRFDFSRQLWPWSGHLALYLRVRPEGGEFEGPARGTVTLTVVSPPKQGEVSPRRSTVTLPLEAAIIPTPPRSRRILWDQFHSLRYPPAYLPRDDLSVRHDILDWHGDHPHTNYHAMYDFLRDQGYFLEVLASPATCFDASQYAALMIVDSEDEFYPEEIVKLEDDVRRHGLGLIVFADWYEEETIARMRFYDDNTRSWWEAVTGGANVPALNDLLRPLGAALASAVHDADVDLPGVAPFQMAAGTGIAAFPAGGLLHNVTTVGEDGEGGERMPVLGLTHVGQGRLVLYGDSNCLDSSHQRSHCHDLLQQVLRYVGGEGGGQLAAPEHELKEAYGSLHEGLPQRRPEVNFTEVSFVLQNPLRCYPNSPLHFHGLHYSPPGGSSGGEGAPPTPVAATLEGPQDAGLVTRAIAADPRRQQHPRQTGAATKQQRLKRRPEPQEGGALLEGRVVSRSGSERKGEGDAPVTPPRRWLRFDLVHVTQAFSVGGSIGLLALWSVTRRRRAANTPLAGGRRLSGLPTFFAQPTHGRAE